VAFPVAVFPISTFNISPLNEMCTDAKRDLIHRDVPDTDRHPAGRRLVVQVRETRAARKRAV